MARSPLFAALRRAARQARWSLRNQVPPQETLERWRDAALSRRTLIKGGAASAAWLAISSGRGAAAKPAAGPDVAIVGGGIAGLTAAFRLQQAGVGARVYEAQERTGGRMFSLRGQFADSQVAELGGELIDTGHVHLQRLAREFRLALDDLHDEPKGLVGDLWYFGGQARREAEVVAEFTHLLPRIKAALVPLGEDGVSYNNHNGGETLDRQSIAEWLSAAGVSGWFRDLLDVAYTTEFGLEIGEQSSLNFLQMIGTEAGRFEVFGESDERFHIRGGNDRVPAELARRLEGRVETGMRLQALAHGADGRYRLTFDHGGVAREVAADHVVLAIPFTLLREVDLRLELPPAKTRAIRELGYGTNAKLMLGASERVWRTHSHSNGSSFSDLPYQSSWETSRRQAGKAGILTNFVGGRHGLEIGNGTAAEQAARATRDFERVFPGFAAARQGMTEARFHWPTFPFTKGSYSCYRVGQYTTISGAEGEAVGNLHFAGEHTSAEAQGYMEGGCESGERVAVEILNDLGLKQAAKRLVIAA